MLTVIEEHDNRFYIAKSTLPHGGLGVFARNIIRRGDYLEIIGVMVENDSAADDCTHYTNNYKFSARLKNSTRKIIPLGFAAIVNHALDQKNMNMAMAYIGGPKQNEHSSNLALVAVKDIYPAEECLHFYGDKWNKNLKWKSSAIEVTEKESEWDKFLSYKLYNLDFFQRLLGKTSKP